MACWAEFLVKSAPSGLKRLDIGRLQLFDVEAPRKGWEENGKCLLRLLKLKVGMLDRKDAKIGHFWQSCSIWVQELSHVEDFRPSTGHFYERGFASIAGHKEVTPSTIYASFRLLCVPDTYLYVVTSHYKCFSH